MNERFAPSSSIWPQMYGISIDWPAKGTLTTQ